jgi:hypothetical protein
MLVLLLTACSRGSSQQPDVQVTLDVAPKPPVVGAATVTVSLAEQSGAPITGANVNLEGDMSHAGMQSVQAQAREVSPGRYQAEIHFTMGGDWFVVVHAALPDGRTLEREMSIGNVRS